jgi:hypothetical protein
MSVRAIVSIASILGLLVTAAAAQQAETAAAASASSALTNPPVFQGLMLDAKGKTVGRLFLGFGQEQDAIFGSTTTVVRQINGIWVLLGVVDFTSGFQIIVDPSNIMAYFYQSADCTGQAYLPVKLNYAATTPAQGIVAVIPPATTPSIYFAGTPAMVTFKSFRGVGQGCQPGNQAFFAGLLQSVPVSSLGLTLPFSIK